MLLILLPSGSCGIFEILSIVGEIPLLVLPLDLQLGQPRRDIVFALDEHQQKGHCLLVVVRVLGLVDR